VIGRVWREQPGMLLIFYMELGWLPFQIARVESDSQDAPLPHALIACTILGFLAWRVCRGGTISWAILMLLSAFNLAVTVVGTVWPWSFSTYWQAALAAIQLGLLFSPAVWHRLGTRRRQQAQLPPVR
jgi:hypothetical protein